VKSADSTWTANPFAIHFGASEQATGALRGEAQAAGIDVITVDVSDIHDRGALSDRLADTFHYPFEAHGLDAAISLISDLEWLGASKGHLFIVEGLDDAPEVLWEMAGILPNIVDRWRTQGLPFVAVLVSRHRPAAAASLAEANERLDAAGQLPWINDTRAVIVVDRGVDQEPDPQELT
jgi:hypothetical protein